jgi:acyl carrier protein
MALPSKAEILAEIQSVFKELFQLDPAQVKPEARLIEDLDLDSLDAIDLAVRLEESSGIHFDEDKLRSLRTVEDVIVTIQELASAQGSFSLARADS